MHLFFIYIIYHMKYNQTLIAFIQSLCVQDEGLGLMNKYHQIQIFIIKLIRQIQKLYN